MRAGAIAIVLGAALAAPSSAVAQVPETFRFDGGAFDRAAALVTDASGNTYVGGSVESAAGASPFAVVKLDASRTQRVIARYDGSRGGIGGSARAVAVDGAGNIYAAGFVGDGVMFNDNLDVLVVKFAPDGTQRWARRFNGPGNGRDTASAVAVDGAGNAYVTGASYGGASNVDWSTLKFAPDGTVEWERRISGAGFSDDRPTDLGVQPDGVVVVTGTTQNTGDGLTNDAETVAYDTGGGIAWRARFTDDAASHELITDLDMDATGRIVITGTTAENHGPYVEPTPITLRYERDGGLLQTIRDGGFSVDVDAAGHFLVAGPAAAASVSLYDDAGNRVWTTPLTTAPDEQLLTPYVAADAQSAVTVAGTARDRSTLDSDYLTFRFSAGGRELFRHRFEGLNEGGRENDVVGVAPGAGDAVFVAGTSWNGHASFGGGTATDIVTLRFSAGSGTPQLVAPSELTATALSTSRIRLGWQHNAQTEDGFRVERCTGLGCDDFAEVAVVGRDVTSFVDVRLARNTTYSYRVRSFNASGVSVASHTATAKTRRF